ncbi:hypothetical protein BD310DRAFT_917847 [Dichomitus squalens]|uniref:BTB domain-containing protein n=1 Tax=Dichomitus squalens TaxID=114155 RepID=A0A4Q9Q6P7_9APHY|nr:hypothetical protein BD310DRAFT_917847 [Dichomitus squalens]
MSFEGTRLSKRARPDDDSGGTRSLEDVVQDKEFWLEDGNIVLIAGKTAFKIYRGLIAAQSLVFSDMLATARPDAEQLYDGCPVDRLSDSPLDLRYLLRALIPKTSISIYLSHDENCYTFEQLFALTHLGHKYQMDVVERQAVSCLKLLFTDDFEHYAHGIGAVQLARLTNNPGMLPVALYLCSLDASVLAHGWTRADGTVERLEPEDLERCIDGYEILREETSTVLARIFQFASSWECTAPNSCEVLCLAVFHALASAFSERHTLLHSWEDMYDEWMVSSHVTLCTACMEALCEREKEQRSAIWRRLPKIYGLPVPDGWETS